MTAAVRAQLLAAGAKLPTEPQKKPATPLKVPRSTTEPPQASRVAQGQENEQDETPTPPLGAQHYIGPFQLTVANGTHFPGRMRAVFVGPADEGLLRAVLDTMNAYCKTRRDASGGDS